MTKTTSTTQKAAALARLSELRQARLDLDRAEVVAVADARNLGLTWREMAPPFGMTFQYMQRRFSKLVKQKVTVSPVTDPAVEGKNARRRPRS